MNLSDIGKKIESAAPVIADLLAGPEAGGAVALLQKAFGCGSDPQSIHDAVMAPGAWDKLRELEITEKETLAALAEKVKEAELQADSTQVVAVNDTMRTEDTTGRGGWREVFGYIAALCFGAEVAVVLYTMAVNPANVAGIVSLVSALTPLWGVPLAVLGISTWHQGAIARVKAGDTTLSAALAAKWGAGAGS